DAGAYQKPLTMTVNLTLAADTELLERVCESGSDHWLGTLSDVQDAAAKVSPDVLTRYVGVYTGLWGTNPRKVDVAMVEGQLMIHINDDPEPLPLIPVSEKLF